MRIAINTRFLLKGKMEGFGWFTFETVKRIVTAHPEHEFFFFFDRTFDPKFIFAQNVTPVVLHPQARHPILFKIWFDFSVTRALKKYKIDLFFSPDGYLSLKTLVPQVGVIHDLNFEHYPLDLPGSPRRYLQTYFPRFAKKASQLITVSEFSKADIVAQYGIEPHKITVAYNGGSDQFQPIETSKQLEIREKFTSGKPFFIYVGALHARKNVDRLFKAFDQFKETTGSQTQLLIVGDPLWKNDKNNSTINGLKHSKSIHFSGHVGIEILTQLMGSAKALTLVSYFEGFGIPIVEAFKSHTPVLCGNLTAPPEVAGDAALLVDPFSVESIAAGLKTMDENDELRADLIIKGIDRATIFSWDKSAERIWEVLENELKRIK